MSIDVIFLLFLVLAVFRGVRHGFIISVCSFVAIFIGLAAAIRLSASVAAHISATAHHPNRWMPVLTFLLIFLGVVILVRLGARLAEKAVDLAMMGWLNKLAGVLLYAAIYTIILSVVLFYAVQLHLIGAKTLSSSVTFPFIRPWGRVVIDEFGKFVPWFKGMFINLEDFFSRFDS
ncbi:MAG TPA: CvpA family protein [Puia sp.]|jgi:membrane protein required for colicin V production|nr:CvpA family protein [Puia sp.]